MINIDARVRLYLFVDPCDMRRQMDSLIGVVNEHLPEAAVAGRIYIFMNRRRNDVRLLFLDSSGVCLFSKRLFKGSVGSNWATGLSLDSAVLEINARILTELLSGSRG